MKLLIAGAGGHGRVVADAALASCAFTAVAFLDDRYPDLKLAEGWPVVGTLATIDQHADYRNFVAAFGDAAMRLDMLGRATSAGFDLPVIAHPAAVISRYAVVGKGSVVIAGAIINVGATIGEGCIINTAASVDHDCVLGNGVHICPGARLAGNVEIGSRTWFGIGAVVKQSVRIGNDVVVGAGAVVIRNIPSGTTVIGNPARLLDV